MGNVSKIKREMNGVLQAAFNINSSTETEALYKMLDGLLYAVNEATNITITNSDGTILYANEAFCRLAQYDKEEMIGQNYRMLNAGIHKQAFFEHMWETITNGRTWHGEIQNKAKDGSAFFVLTTIVPCVDEQGRAHHFISFQTNITEQKQIEAQFKTNFIRTFKRLQNGIFKVRKEPDGTLKYTMSEGRLMDEIGTNTEAISSKSPFDVFQLDIANKKQKYYLQAFEGKRVDYELELNGVLIYVDLEPIKHKGEVIEIVGTVYDFSEFRNVQKRLKLHKERYQSLINYSHEYIMTLDKDGMIIHMNTKTMQLLGVEQPTYRKINLAEVATGKRRAVMEDCFAKALRGEVQFFEFDVKKAEERICLNVTLVPIMIDHEINGVNVIGIDMTDERLIQERNAYLAHHDELTDLPNRRWMEQKIQEVLKLGEHVHPLALLSLDLDRFKFVNDTLGHFVGDELLQQIASRLQHSIYKDKIHVARMGGDEFMILCPHVETECEIKDIAQSILNSLEEPFYLQGFELLVTASIGIILHPAKDTDVTELMKRVDVALYQSKELGRNMYQIYDSSMNRENYQLFMLERDLRKAVMNDEFIVHYQPRVDALTGKTVGAEALLRWNHPEHGLISPGQFIPIAEETGLIIPIGKWVKKKVCEQLVAWRRANVPLIPISVNISSNRFLQKDFANDIRELLQTFELAGKWLEIEITENSIMRNEAIVQKTLKDLKEMGVKIFIDDFGTGYSSFNYLKTFALDGVKIDRSFIQDIAEQPENASITSAMIKLAQYLKLEVIAEGVETKEELDYLLSENCHYIQGFYFGKPCSIEQFERSYMHNIDESHDIH